MERLVEPVAWGQVPLQGYDARESAQRARRFNTLGYELSTNGVKDRIDAPTPAVSSSATSKTFSEV